MNLKSYLFFFILFQKILNIDYNDYTCSASNVKSEHGCLPYDSNSSEENLVIIFSFFIKFLKSLK